MPAKKADDNAKHQEAIKKVIKALDASTKQKILEAAVSQKLKKLPTSKKSATKPSDLDAEWG